MDSLKQTRELLIHRLAEVAAAASLATVVVYVAVIATSPAALSLTGISA